MTIVWKAMAEAALEGQSLPFCFTYATCGLYIGVGARQAVVYSAEGARLRPLLRQSLLRCYSPAMPGMR